MQEPAAPQPPLLPTTPRARTPFPGQDAPTWILGPLSQPPCPTTRPPPSFSDSHIQPFSTYPDPGSMFASRDPPLLSPSQTGLDKGCVYTHTHTPPPCLHGPPTLQHPPVCLPSPSSAPNAPAAKSRALFTSPVSGSRAAWQRSHGPGSQPPGFPPTAPSSLLQGLRLLPVSVNIQPLGPPSRLNPHSHPWGQTPPPIDPQLMNPTSSQACLPCSPHRLCSHAYDCSSL